MVVVPVRKAPIESGEKGKNLITYHRPGRRDEDDPVGKGSSDLLKIVRLEAIDVEFQGGRHGHQG
jgi:hypothetical protein